MPPSAPPPAVLAAGINAPTAVPRRPAVAFRLPAVPWRYVAPLLVVAGLAGLLAMLIARGRPVPNGPVEVVWNQQSCTHCRMSVGEPAHAAQIITDAGDVLVFDDPGCLLHYLDGQVPSVHRIWFHNSVGAGWLTDHEVGFATGATTPMGYGLAAIPATTPGALDLGAARRHLGLATTDLKARALP